MQDYGWPELTLQMMPQLDRICEQVARRYPGEFCWSRSFDSEFAWKLMQNGFLPMACLTDDEEEEIFTPKLHVRRCLQMFSEIPPPHKSTMRKAKKFTFTVNSNFQAVVEGIRRQHDHCWFYPKLVAMYAQLQLTRSVMHTFEVYFDGKLVAGEMGYSVGATYTSLSGFSEMDSAGTVQMYAMASYLHKQGFIMWDLGMQIEYKANEFGGREVPRMEFIELLKKHSSTVVIVPPLLERTNAKEWLSSL